MAVFERYALVIVALMLCSTHALRKNPKSDDSAVGDAIAATPVTVRTIWIRHGTSCANIIRQFTKVPLLGIFTQHTSADPSLTHCAIDIAQKIGRQLHPKVSALSNQSGWQGPLLVFSSVLVRAMETALYNFPQNDVYPIPYIAEADFGADNIPLPWSLPSKTGQQQDQQQSKLTKKPNNGDTVRRLKFVEGVNDVDDADRDSEHKDDFNMFKREFPKIISALLPEEYVVSGATIPVVIVSHSGYMKKHLQCDGSRKPRNNEAWIKEYSVELVKQSALSASQLALPVKKRPVISELAPRKQECETPLFDKEVYPEYKGAKWMGMRYPCELDVDRCSRTNFWMPSEIKGKKCCPM